MRKFLLAVLLLTPIVTLGQGGGQYSIIRPRSTTPSTCATTEGALYWDTVGLTIKVCTATNSWSVVTGIGTVTSVAETFTGGIVTVAGSPINTSGTLALTIAGTSGGIVYFSDGTHWASSGALTANLPVIGGGAGVSPAVGTRSGNTTNFVTQSGSIASTHIFVADANGNAVDGGAPSAGGTVTTFSAGNLSPLFTSSVATAATTPALTFSLSTAAAHKVFMNNTGSTAAPGYQSIGTGDLPFTYSGNTTELATVTGALTSTHLVAIDASGNLVDGGLPTGCVPGGSSGNLLYNNSGACGGTSFSWGSNILSSNAASSENFTAQTGANSAKLLPIMATCAPTVDGAMTLDSDNHWLAVGSNGSCFQPAAIGGDIGGSSPLTPLIVGWQAVGLDATMATPSNGQVPTYNSGTGKWAPTTLSLTGSGTAGRVTYWSSSSALTSSANMTFDSTTGLAVTATGGISTPQLTLTGSGFVTFPGTVIQNNCNVVASGASPAFDLSLSPCQQITLANNAAPSVSNIPKGVLITFIIVENGTGGFTWAEPAGFHGGAAITTTANTRNTRMYVCSNNGTDCYYIAGAQSTGGTP